MESDFKKKIYFEASNMFVYFFKKNIVGIIVSSITYISSTIYVYYFSFKVNNIAYLDIISTLICAPSLLMFASYVFFYIKAIKVTYDARLNELYNIKLNNGENADEILCKTTETNIVKVPLSCVILYVSFLLLAICSIALLYSETRKLRYENTKNIEESEKCIVNSNIIDKKLKKQEERLKRAENRTDINLFQCSFLLYKSNSCVMNCLKNGDKYTIDALLK